MCPSHRRQRVDCIALMLGSLSLPAGAFAADAHQAVKPKPGDIVVLRNVSTRPACRPASPGMALMVDPSPRREVARSSGIEELSDADYANLDVAAPGQRGGHGTVVEQMVGRVFCGMPNGSNGHPAAPATASAPAVRRVADNRASG